MRWLVLILGVTAGPLAAASPWGLEVGLIGGMGVSRFAGEPTPMPPKVSSTNLFAVYPPSATGSQGTGLAGSAGASFWLIRKRRIYLGLELLASGEMLKFDEDLTFPSGTTVRQSTVWEWSGFRPTALVAYAWPFKMGESWALAPRLGGGAWYEKIDNRGKHVGYDGGDPKDFKWTDAPPDDWGWIATVGMDWLRLGPGQGPARIGIEARWREGHALPEVVAGADKPVRVVDAVLTVPMWLIGF